MSRVFPRVRRRHGTFVSEESGREALEVESSVEEDAAIAGGGRAEESASERLRLAEERSRREFRWAQTRFW